MLSILDPLADTSERFALGRPRHTQPDAGSEPSVVRPFGLRFAGPPMATADLDVSGWRLCPDGQILIGRDGVEIVDMTMKTTGPSGDGGSGGGAEEWRPDHHDDEGLPA